MVYKIAFASSDGISTDRHFGAAERFYIAELDTEKMDYEITGFTEVRAPCNGGWHEVSKFEAVLSALADVSVITAQRIGPGAMEYIRENGKAAYQIPLDIEQVLCLFMEEKQWEVDKWRSHTKN